MALALIALLPMLWAMSRYMDDRRAVPPPQALPAATPPPALAAPLKMKKVRLHASEAPALKAPGMIASLLEKTAEPAKVRGEKLRLKGEAMGGSTPDRVDPSAQ